MTLRGDKIVYIVDDDDDVRDSLQELVQCSGFKVQGFASGRTFLQEFDPHIGVCIILDLHMPDISGFRVLDALQARASSVPVILFTGRSDSTTEEFANRSGVIALLAKPIDPEKMIGLIEHLDAKRAAA